MAGAAQICEFGLGETCQGLARNILRSNEPKFVWGYRFRPRSPFSATKHVVVCNQWKHGPWVLPKNPGAVLGVLQDEDHGFLGPITMEKKMETIGIIGII